MDTVEIQKRLDLLVEDMLKKGLKQPTANMTMKSGAEPDLYITRTLRNYRSGVDTGEYEFFSHERGSLDEMFARAQSWIDAQPSPEEAQKAEFQRVLAGVIDYGHELQIDAEFLNPLIAAARTLAENAITHQPQPLPQKMEEEKILW